MTRFPTPRTGPATAARGPGGDLDDGQVDRLAALIAEGRAEVPDGLPPACRERLLAATRRRLRGRLVRLIARAIAWRLYREARPELEDAKDA